MKPSGECSNSHGNFDDIFFVEKNTLHQLPHWWQRNNISNVSFNIMMLEWSDWVRVSFWTERVLLYGLLIHDDAISYHIQYPITHIHRHPLYSHLLNFNFTLNISCISYTHHKKRKNAKYACIQNRNDPLHFGRNLCSYRNKIEIWEEKNK